MPTQPPLRFEVASIRPQQSRRRRTLQPPVLPGGRFVATATTVRTLIRIAFGTDDNRISGAPSWTDNETFDINATTVNHAEVTTPQQFQQLILSLLEDRFQLKFHREQKEAPSTGSNSTSPENSAPPSSQALPTRSPT
jgi:uncharacterized protein (TIGR03435 family)